MKNICRVLSVAYCLISYSNPSFSGWTQTNGPFGRQISFFCVADNRLFALTNDSIFLSLNTGKSWRAINHSQPSIGMWFRSFAVIGQNLFVNSYVDGWFHSTNNGESWSEYDGNISGSPIWDMAVCGGRLFAGTWGAGVFISTDTGNTWMAANNGLTDLSIGSIRAKGTNLFVSNGTGFFLSTDEGSSWSLIASADKGFTFISAHDSTLFANVLVGPGGGLYRSTDRGKNWIFLENGPAPAGFDAFAVHGKDIFVGVNHAYLDGGVFLSSDDGLNWIRINNGMTSNEVSALAATDSILFAGTSHGGVYVSTNRGANWAEANNGLSGSYGLAVASLAVSGETIIAGTWGGGVFLSSDNGMNWNESNEGLGDKHVLSLLVHGPTMFAGTAIGGVYRSDDGGAKWNSINSGLPIGVPAQGFLPIAISDTVLFAGFDAVAPGVYRSTNGGSSWTVVDSGLPGQAINSVMCLAANDSNVFVGGNGVFRSSDLGSYWISDTSNLSMPGGSIMSIALGDSNIFAGTYSNGVFRRPTSGARWTPVNNGLPTSGCYVRAIAAAGANIFAGINGSGVYLSTDRGESWTNVSPDLTYQDIYSLAINGSDVFVGFLGDVGQGSWHRSLSEMVTKVSNKNTQYPFHYALEQNYPNPFNPSTVVTFEVPSRVFVRVKVFDILGREVATIVSEELSAGKHSRQWNAGNMSSGIYFLRLQTKDYFETKRMIVLK